MTELWAFSAAQLITMAASSLLALVIGLILPKMNFKIDAPLATYRKRWAGYAAILATPLAYALTFLGQSLGFLIAVIFVAGIGAVFVVTDQVHHRVPNAQMVTLYTGVGAGLLIDAPVTGHWINLLWAGVGFLSVAIWFFGMFMAGMGMGDLKAFAIIAAPIAYMSGPLTLIWIVSGYVVGALYGIMLLLGGAGKKANMPLVPPFALSLLLIPAMISAGFDKIW